MAMCERVRKRGCGATHCYGCLCDTCANSDELLSWYFTPGETEEPCFSCDECRHYDGDIKKDDQWTNSCQRYIETRKAKSAREQEIARREEKRARYLRSTLRVIKGGGQN